MCRNVVTQMSPHRNGQTKMSRDRIGQTETSRTPVINQNASWWLVYIFIRFRARASFPQTLGCGILVACPNQSSWDLPFRNSWTFRASQISQLHTASRNVTPWALRKNPISTLKLGKEFFQPLSKNRHWLSDSSADIQFCRGFRQLNRLLTAVLEICQNLFWVPAW